MQALSRHETLYDSSLFQGGAPLGLDIVIATALT